MDLATRCASMAIDVAEREGGAKGAVAGLCWAVQEALVGQQQTLRLPATVGVARHLLEKAQRRSWYLTTAAVSSFLGEGPLPSSSAGTAADLNFMMPLSSPPQQASRCLASYVQMLVWMADTKALDPESPGAVSSWLLPLVASLCVTLADTAAVPALGLNWALSLARAQDPVVARGRGAGESVRSAVLYAMRACLAQSAHLPVLDLLNAHLVADSSFQAPLEVAKLAAASVVELEAYWDFGDPILRAFGLDFNAWASSTKSASKILIDPDLSPQGLPRSLITLLINSPSFGLDPTATSLALSAAADLLLQIPQQHLPSHPLQRVLFELDVFSAAAEAAVCLAVYLAVPLGKDCDGGEEARMSARRHCRDAGAVARRFIDATSDASESSAVFIHVVSVFKAAQQPAEAAAFALDLLTAAPSPRLPPLEKEVTLGEEAPTWEMQGWVAAAMSLANALGFYEGTLVLLQEVLARHGAVVHKDLMHELCKGAALDPKIASAIEETVGEDGYFQFIMTQGSDAAVQAVRANPSWMEAFSSSGLPAWRDRIESAAAGWTPPPLPSLSIPPSAPPPYVREFSRSGNSIDSYEDSIEAEAELLEGPSTTGVSGYVVALFGGMELKESDREMLARISPPGSEIRWFGADGNVGTNPTSKLRQLIRHGYVDSVYIQTMHNGHTGTSVIKRACQIHGVKFQMVGKGAKALLKAEGLRARYYQGGMT